MSRPTDRERQLAVRYAKLDEEHLADGLAAFREEVLKPFEEMRKDFQAMRDDKVVRTLDELLKTARGLA